MLFQTFHSTPKITIAPVLTPAEANIFISILIDAENKPGKDN